MTSFDPTTVIYTREELRLVEGAGMCDPIESGTVVARYAPGTSLTEMRRDVIHFAMAHRGEFYSLDLFSHKGIWERFLTVSYEEAWEIDPETGIILDRNAAKAVSGDESDSIASARERFEHERDRRKAAHQRQQSRGTGKATKTATNH